jgi:hypothetical protein
MDAQKQTEGVWWSTLTKSCRRGIALQRKLDHYTAGVTDHLWDVEDMIALLEREESAPKAAESN